MSGFKTTERLRGLPSAAASEVAASWGAERASDRAIQTAVDQYNQRGQYGEPSQAEKENFTAPKDDLTLLLEVSNLKLKVEKLEANARSSERSRAYLARLLGAIEARVDLIEIHRKKDRGEA